MGGGEGGGQHCRRVLPEPREHLGTGAGDPGRGLSEALPVRVFADPDQQFPNGSLDAIRVESGWQGVPDTVGGAGASPTRQVTRHGNPPELRRPA